jgi:hypothetical protein
VVTVGALVVVLLGVVVVPLRRARVVSPAVRGAVVVAAMVVLLGEVVVAIGRVVLGVVAVAVVAAAVAMVPIRRPGAPMVPVLAVAQLAARGRDVVVYVLVVARDRGGVVVLAVVTVVAVRAAAVVPGVVMVAVFVVVPILVLVVVVTVLVVVVIAVLGVPVRRLLAPRIVKVPAGSLLLVAIQVSMLRRLQKLLGELRGVLQGELAQLLRGRRGPRWSIHCGVA